MPKVFGFAADGDDLVDKTVALWQGVAAGHVNGMALAIGAGSLALILALRHWRTQWSGVLIAVVAATAISAWFDLGQSAHIGVLGSLPQGLPVPHLPLVSWHDLHQLLPGAAIIALLSFTDTSVLSRTLAARARTRVSQNHETIAIGVANICAGLFQGSSISSSSSRTPVAEAAGARTQITYIVGAAVISLMLIVAPSLLRHLPSALLGAVVIAACLVFTDVRGMLELHRLRRVEFALSVISFLGAAFVGVIEGIGIAIVLALLMLVWNAWRPRFVPWCVWTGARVTTMSAAIRKGGTCRASSYSAGMRNCSSPTPRFFVTRSSMRRSRHPRRRAGWWWPRMRSPTSTSRRPIRFWSCIGSWPRWALNCTLPGLRGRCAICWPTTVCSA